MSYFVDILSTSSLIIFTLMSCLWLISYKKSSLSLVDLGWTISIFIVMITSLMLGPGFFPRKILIGFMVGVWAIRLISHLISRFSFSQDDPRYTAIVKKWPSQVQMIKTYLLFNLQGIIALILSLPFIITCINSSTDWSLFEGLAIILWMIGIVGETLADNQLKEFKKDLKNQQLVCENGLWYYSRHPNYFFEFIIWLSFGLFAFGSPFGIFALISPALMLFLLLKISGVPPAEEQALKTKGSLYKEYQKTTSTFIPWFKYD